MSTFNRVILLGNLGQDPNTKFFDAGVQVTTFSMATSEHSKDKQTGEKKSITEWSNITLNGKLSEIAEKYLHKGDKVLIEGVLRTRKWKGTDDIERYSTEIIGRNLTMVSTKSPEENPPSLTQGQTESISQKPTENFPYPNPGDEDESDLPF